MSPKLKKKHNCNAIRGLLDMVNDKYNVHTHHCRQTRLRTNVMRVSLSFIVKFHSRNKILKVVIFIAIQQK